MFKKGVIDTDICTVQVPVSTEILGTTIEPINRISGPWFIDDGSFSATLRLLLSNRISDSDSPRADVYPRSIRAGRLDNKSDFECLAWVGTEHGGLHSLSIHVIGGGNSDDRDRLFRILDDDKVNPMARKDRDYTRLKDIETYLNQKGYRSRVYQKDDTEVYIEGDWSFRMNRILLSIVPRLMPWYFVDTPLDADEKSLLTMYMNSNTTPEELLDTIQKLTDRLNIRKRRVRELLKDFGSTVLNNNIADTKNYIKSYRDRINQLYSEISLVMTRIDEYNLKLTALMDKSTQDSGASEDVIDYILNNKRLILNDVSDDRLYVTVKTYLDNYDSDLAERLIENRGSYLYNAKDLFCEYPDEIHDVLKATFIEERFKIKTVASIFLDMSSYKYGKAMYLNRGWEVHSDRIPNSHIIDYECFGTNGTEILKALQSHDIITALSLSVASVSNLNFGDPIVGARILYNIIKSKQKIFEDANGKCYTFSEVLKVIRGESNEQTNSAD